VNFADGTSWTKTDINDIIAGKKAPFSTAPAPMAPMSASVSDDADTAEALALLSSPSSPLGFHLDPFSDDGGFEASGAGTTDWELDPSLAIIINEPEISSAGEYDLAQQDMDIAVAALGFGTQDAEQAGDIYSGASPNSDLGQAAISTSPEGSGEYFGQNDDRQSA
jgi:hypothetical protein